ncbi:hypothetical protein GDO78_001492 [Eleutherodactylus coqui]|uniref:Translin-associated factor X-interacting protein 1 N-terminal domain-containing protein n=1 Tax=Eleutherodactylus coqui TaxID=57060 RepID=A0A8J6FTT3_ELECQ|nr:hypothetical protein GDO78_001492 [Eleutherodactylus coqui]
MLKTKHQDKRLLLNVLLDGVERANKKDSWDYTGGHLNHDHLFKPPVLENKHFWRSGKMPDQYYEKAKKVKDSYMNFKPKPSSVNGDPNVKSFSASSSVIKQTDPFIPMNTPVGSSVVNVQFQTTSDDHDNPEDREYRGSTPRNKKLQLPELNVLNFGELQTSQDNRKENQFPPSYITGVTKSDQFNMFLQFDRDILQKHNQSTDFYKKATVECYEKALTKELLNIAHIRPPHFAHLQIFSETFEKICKESSIFGNILHYIKMEPKSHPNMSYSKHFVATTGCFYTGR